MNKMHTGVYCKLNKELDADILNQLKSVHNKQGYIKQLIRLDIEHNKTMKKLKEDEDVE